MLSLSSLLILALSHPWRVLAALLFVYLVDKILVYRKLRHFRGPPGTGFLDSIHSRALLGLKCHEWYGEVIREYGPIARIAPNVLITSSADLWQRASAVRSPYTRSAWYYKATRIEAGRDHIVSQTDNDKHEIRRKQMAAGYSGKENVHLDSDIDVRLQEFIALIRNNYLSTASQTKPMDFARKVQYLTLDVISTLSLGESFGMLTSNADIHGYMKSGEEGLWMCNTTLALGINWIIQIPIIGQFLMPNAKDATGFGKMIGTAYKMVDERVNRATTGRSDMLASFVKNGLVGADLKSETLEVILAGSDTTASGIRGIMLYVLTNPRVYKKLQAEIDATVVKGFETSVFEVVPNTVTRSMPYLQACIREGLRIFPPVANIFSRDVPAGGDTVTVDGKSYFLPGGTSLGYSAWGMHHDKALYGEDADSFRPERWLIDDDSKLKEMVRVNELIFGHGRWKCLGQQIALIEIGKTVFELLRHFDIAILNPEKPWKNQNYMGLFAMEDMWVQVNARD